MRETNIYEYYAFGYNYHNLRYTNEGIPVREGENSLCFRIDGFFGTLEELDMPVTETAAKELRDIREHAGQLSEDARVDSELADRVRTAVDNVDVTLDAELKLRSAFVVTPKRFHLDHLLKSPQNLFGSSVFASLPPLCQFDFREACRCIAFGLPTAAGFHLMRGVEGVLRHYYCSIVKRGRIRMLLWNNMVEHLRKRRDAPPKPLMDSLDNIRVNYRNPTQHPEARYNMDEAQDLLAVSIDAVNRMLRDLSERSA